MICSQCGREIPDGSLSCNYCGKIFVTKRAPGELPVSRESLVATQPAPIPRGSGGSLVQPNRPQSVDSVAKAVAFRRYQRWFFYLVITAIFVAGIFYITKISSDNSALVAKINDGDMALKAQKDAIEARDNQIKVKETQLQDAKNSFQDVQVSLQAANKLLVDANAANEKSIKDITNLQDAVSAAQAMATTSLSVSRNLIQELGISIATKEVALLPLASLPEQMNGLDTDKDGIPDWFETIIGTDPLLADTDKDGYSDLDEIRKGFNPIGPGKIPVDLALANKYKGKILLEKVSSKLSYAWYIGQNGLRYYLGSSADNYQNLLTSTYWTK
ncbi:MAG: hypothetical protein WCO55_02110 [Candidatus Falkowbacteria bacterium]